MNAEEFFQQLLGQDANRERDYLGELTPTKIDLEENHTTTSLREQVPSGFILIGMTLLLILLKKSNWKPKGIVNSWSQVPCKNCRFFSLNSSCKCAIHPSIVLTAKANNCSDYWALDSKFLRK